MDARPSLFEWMTRDEFQVAWALVVLHLSSAGDDLLDAYLMPEESDDDAVHLMKAAIRLLAHEMGYEHQWLRVSPDLRRILCTVPSPPNHGNRNFQVLLENLRMMPDPLLAIAAFEREAKERCWSATELIDRLRALRAMIEDDVRATKPDDKELKERMQLREQLRAAALAGPGRMQ